MVQRVSDRRPGGMRGGMAGIWQQVRNLGIVVPGRDLVAPRALNPEDLPLQLSEEGQLVYVTEVHFDYKGPATTLQVGFGWKPTTPLDFDDGANLLQIPFQGYGSTVPFGVAEHIDWFPYRIDLLAAEASFFAPAIGDNMTRFFDHYTIGYGDTVDTWVWIYDRVKLGIYALGPDTEFLAIDTDADVIRMPEEVVVPESAVANLEVRYGL